MGKIGVRGGLAECRHAVALRVLAILAQHHRRRCGAVPEALHRTADLDECTRLGNLAGSEINDAKIALANAVTTLCHGAKAASAAQATAHEVFEHGGVGEDLPTLHLTAAEVADGVTVAQLFVRTGLAKSGKDAKRLIAEGGARLNDDLVLDAGQVVAAGDLAEPMKLTAGRKRHALVVLG